MKIIVSLACLSAVALLSGAAQAAEEKNNVKNENYAITEKVFQRGVYKKNNCTSPKDIPFDNCYCRADLSFPLITSDKFKQSAQSFGESLRFNISEKSCVGTKLEKPDPKKAESGEDRTMRYKVLFQGPTIFSLLLESYVFAGGAHGATDVEAFTANMETTRVYSLEDIIGSRPEDVRKLNLEINKALLAKPDGEVRKEELKSNPREFIRESKCINCVVYPTKEGLNVTFQAYEVAPYSSGNVTVTLPKVLIANKEILKELESKQ